MHGWGLYAAGPIAANVFVIEYIGELLRRPLDDVREKVCVLRAGQQLQLDLLKGSGHMRICSLQLAEAATAFNRQLVQRSSS